MCIIHRLLFVLTSLVFLIIIASPAVCQNAPASDIEMTKKKLHFLTDLVGFIGTVLIFYLIWRSYKKIEKPTGAVLLPDEAKIGEIYCENTKLKFRGLLLSSSAIEGKLILTKRRLLYSTYDEKKVALSLEPKDVEHITIGEKGIFRKIQTLVIEYFDKRKMRQMSATFTFPEKIAHSNPLFGKLEYKNPLTLETFVEHLWKWKGSNEEFLECSVCGALVPESAKQCPKCKSAFEEALPNEK